VEVDEPPEQGDYQDKGRGDEGRHGGSRKHSGGAIALFANLLVSVHLPIDHFGALSQSTNRTPYLL